MRAFATVQQYVDRYGTVEDVGMLQECLNDATRQLSATLAERGIDPATIDRGLLMQACRQMAERVAPKAHGENVPVGATSLSMTVGDLTRSYNLAGAYGSPRVTPDELRLLGMSGGRVGWAPLSGGGCRG